MDQQTEQTTKPVRYTVEARGWYRLVRGIVRFFLRLAAHIDVAGLEHVPDRGPYLLVTNHLNWLDPPLIASMHPNRVYVFAAEKWENHWFLGPFMRSVDAIFVRRGEVDRKALRQALVVLEQGAVLGMSPEGTRSRTGVLQQGRSGAAYMAYRSGAPLVPVALSGQEKVVHSLLHLHRARVRVLFGPPFAPPPTAAGDKASAAEVHAFTEEIMYRLAAMLPPEYRGLYADVTEKRPDLLAQVGVSG
jgi:1-acyl-sn-glycerol-3-phosphate acyltransferase